MNNQEVVVTRKEVAVTKETETKVVTRDKTKTTSPS